MTEAKHKPESITPERDEQDPTVLLFFTDLMFGVQLQNMVRKAGLRAITARPGAPLPGADLMIIDLSARADVPGVIREAVAMGTPTIAFGPHMDAEGRRLAKSSGASRVLTNSNLARDLPPVLQELKEKSDA